MKKENVMRKSILVFVFVIAVFVFCTPSVYAAAAPAAPKLISAKASAYNKITVKWNGVSNAQGYRIYRKSGSSGWTAIKNVNASARSYMDASVKAGTKYTYTVRSYRRVSGKVVWGGYSRKGLTTTTPKAVSQSVGTVKLRAVKANSSTRVSLTWNAASGASGYRIYRKTGNSGWKALKNVSASTRSCVDTSVKAGTKYTYTVRAYRRVNGRVIWGGYNKKGLTVNIPGKTIEMRNYFQKGVSKSEMQRLATAVGGMRKGSNSKYPSLYYTGNNMIVGVNLNAVYGTYKDEYVRIRNSGNKNVLFYGVKIGDTRQQMEKKFSKYNIRSWDGGKTYTNADAWKVKVVFSGGKLKEYTYVCAPTSR